MKNWRTIVTVGCVGVGLGSVACSSVESGGGAPVDALEPARISRLVLDPEDIEHACEHVQEEFGSYTAIADASDPDDRPAVDDHEPYDVTLHGGDAYLQWTVTSNRIAIYTDPNATVTVTSGGWTDVNGGGVVITDEECAQPTWADGGTNPDFGTVDVGLSHYYELTRTGTPPYQIELTIHHGSASKVLALFENVH